MTAAPCPWRPTGTGVAIRFRLTPRASKERIGGLEATADGPAFKAWVRAVPEDGAANAALERLAADWLDLPKSAATLITGAKSRVKVIEIKGDTGALEARLTERLAAVAREG